MSRGDVWLARHPPVDARGLCYGRADVPLAGSVESAVEQLHGTLAGTPLLAVWSSPSSRCARVAKALAATCGAELHIDARLFEIDFGDWEGRPWSSVERDDGAAYARWMNDWKHAAPPNGETIATLTARVEAWLADLRASVARRDGIGSPAVIAHAGVIRALRVLIDGVQWEDAMSREVPHLGWQRWPLDPRPNPSLVHALSDGAAPPRSAPLAAGPRDE